MLRNDQIFLLCALIGLLGNRAQGESSAGSPLLVNAEPNSRPDSAEQLINYSSSLEKHSQEQKQQEQAASFPQLARINKEQETPLSMATKFEPSNFKSVYAAIRNHPNLRTFGALCELEGVREFVSLDRSELTVFAPIDRALGDILALAKQRSISPSELAKHHIAPALIVADVSTQLPLKFHSLQQASPLYLGQAPADEQPKQLFVNNAKIIATYLIPIEEGDQAGSHQALHLIDAPLEFAYALKKLQVRQHDGKARSSIQRNALNLDDLISAPEQLTALDDFERRFSDLTAATRAAASNEKELSLFTTRPDKSGLELNVARFLQSARQFAPRLRNRLYATNESGAINAKNQLNTYFLPLSSEQLDALLAGELKMQSLFYEAHVLPDQVLFTRQLGLGKAHSSLYNKFARQSRLELSLAKTRQLNQEQAGPLLLQSKCSSTSKQQQQQLDGEATTLPECQFGVVSSEIVLANVPLANGVLHLLRKPIMVPDSSLINLLNDNANQLTEITHSIGSRTHQSQLNGHKQQEHPKLNRFRELISKNFALLSTINSNSNVTIFAPSDEAFEGLRYDLRALISGDEALIPVHWDSAYRTQLLEKMLRRHLVVGTSVVTSGPDDYDSSSPLLVTSEAGTQMRVKQCAPNNLQDEEAHSQVTLELINNNNHGEQPKGDDSTSFKSRLLEADLIGKNGVLHIIDSVLGEPAETLESLLRSLELRQENVMASQQHQQQANPISELHELVRAQLSNHNQQQQQQQQHQQLASSSSSDLINSVEALQNQQPLQPRAPSENEIISKTISQFLDEIQQQPQQARYQMLASSLNLTLQLARLSGFGSDHSTQAPGDFSASSQADNNGELAWFKDTQRQLTLFAPNDLAWLRLMQVQPEIYKPIFTELLESTSSPLPLDTMKSLQNSPASDMSSSSSSSLASSSAAALLAISRHSRALASQSSQRIKQILERHLVGNARLQADSLNRLERVQTMRATLRLHDQPTELQSGNLQNQLQQQEASSPMSAFAALHSIVTGSGSSSMVQHQQRTNVKQVRKTMSFDSISGIQFNPCCQYVTINGNLYIIDRVLALPDDGLYIQQTGSAPSASSSMSSLLGGHNSFLLELLQTLIGQGHSQAPRNGALILLATLLCGILLLSLLATILLIRRRRQHKKLAGHRQLESGLTSSSSANSTGSTSTTKSL